MNALINAKIEEIKRSRAKAKRKFILILALTAFGILVFIAGSIIAGVQLYKCRERCAEKRRMASDDAGDGTEAAAFYDAEKKEFAETKEKD
ncbi:MAG: hypothetical protein Q4B42_07470 [Oscillospiraceae bacterium]|nr:hypothetical protein [Oscillospiraceae bacterium]